MIPEFYFFGGIVILLIAIKVITSKGESSEGGIFSKAYRGAISFGKKCCGFFKGGVGA